MRNIFALIESYINSVFLPFASLQLLDENQGQVYPASQKINFTALYRTQHS